MQVMGRIPSLTKVSVGNAILLTCNPVQDIRQLFAAVGEVWKRSRDTHPRRVDKP
jgi:hypothetical protein